MDWTGERVIPKKMFNKDNVEQKHLNEILHQHTRRYKFASGLVEGNVLDASCGSGYGTEILNKEADTALGVDVSREAIDYATKNYKGEFATYDLEKEFPKKEFDWIVSFETIEHLENPDLFLSSVNLYAKHFIFSIPINNPSKFHKQVYTLEEAKGLIYRYFDVATWFKQKNNGSILPHRNPEENVRFLIGIT